MESKEDQPKLLCACQEDGDGMIAISFYYGLEGMGKHTPIKVTVPQIGDISDTFEDIKEKLQKIAKKLFKREKKKVRSIQNEPQNEVICLGSITDSQHIDETKSETNGPSSCMKTEGTTEPLPDTYISDQSDIILQDHHDSQSMNTDLNQPDKGDAFVSQKCLENASDTTCALHLDDINMEVGEKLDCMKLINLSIQNQEREIDSSCSNAEGWVNKNYFVIDICGVVVQYAIHVNPARVKNMELPRTIMPGYMVYPRLQIEHAKVEMCDIKWYRCKTKPKHKMANTYRNIFMPNLDENKDDSGKKIESADTNSSKVNTQKHDKANDKSTWTFLQHGFVYMPTDDDLGHFLKVTCDTMHLFSEQNVFVPAEFAESKYVVRNGPGLCPFEKRHQHTVSRTPNGSFRLMTYNILADKYANTKCAMDYYYPYCPPYALSLDYRKQLFMKEILGFNCDILCLQEVDQKVFHDDFERILPKHGYSGEMRTRCKTLSQGEATFYKTDKFIHIGSHHTELTASLLEGTPHKDVLDKVSLNSVLKEAVQERQTMLMVTALQSIETPDKIVLVANTHLSCGARKANLRILQVVTALQHIQHILETVYSGRDVSLIFCGDFNSLPISGVVELLTTGEVSQNHADWFTGGRTEYVHDMSFKTTLQLKSAYEKPLYTNFVSGFYGIIDYIFYDQGKLEATKTVPLPEHSDIIQRTACPNPKFPSDHLSLICDFKFQS